MTETSKNAVNWNLICHLSGLTLYCALPFINVILPFAIWKMKGTQDAVLEREGKEAVNFNLSILIYLVVASLLCYVLVGYALLPLLVVGHLFLVIRAGLRANKAEPVHYPFTLRFIK